MEWFRSRVLWGILLILCGIFFLLQSMGVLPFSEILWSILFGFAAVIFFSVFFQDRAQWWALIPAFASLGIGSTIALGIFWPEIGETLSGPLILGGIGLGFLVVYFLRREQWWVVIPAGVLITLAVVAAVDTISVGNQRSESLTGSIFFIGLGCTFAVLALLSTPQVSLRWAWIPAGILLALGVMLLAAAENLILYLWPAGLVVLGGYLIWRALRGRAA